MSALDERLPYLEAALWQLGDDPAPLSYDALIAVCRRVTPLTETERGRRSSGAWLAARIVKQYRRCGDARPPTTGYDVGVLRKIVAALQEEDA